MNFSGIPEPWGTILALIVGPVGAIVVLGVMVYFLWRLFREEQRENRKNMVTVQTLGDTVHDLSVELRMWRETTRGPK